MLEETFFAKMSPLFFELKNQKQTRNQLQTLLVPLPLRLLRWPKVRVKNVHEVNSPDTTGTYKLHPGALVRAYSDRWAAWIRA